MAVARLIAGLNAATANAWYSMSDAAKQFPWKFALDAEGTSGALVCAVATKLGFADLSDSCIAVILVLLTTNDHQR